jgi:hypothetical protein
MGMWGSSREAVVIGGRRFMGLGGDAYYPLLLFIYIEFSLISRSYIW